MAIYTDFFVASIEELQEACPLRVVPSALPPWQPTRPFSEEALVADFPTTEECDALKKFAYYEQKNLLPDKLEELHALLGGDEKRFSAAFNRPPLMVPGENSFGSIFHLPPEFVCALAELPEDRVAGVAEEWLGDKKANRTISFLRKMAKQTIDQGKNMYLLLIV